MGLSGSRQRTTKTVNQTTTPQVPSWIQGPYQNYMNNVTGLLNAPSSQTSGVPASTLQNQAFGLAGGLGQTNPNMTAANDATTNLLGYTPGNVTAGQLSETDISPYMNPWTQSVVDASLGDIERARQGAISAGQGSATMAGAYGGSRHGVADSLTNAEAFRAAGSTAAGLRSQGFLNAQNAALTDIGNRMGADQFNVNSGLAGANFRLGAANQLGNLAGQQSNSRIAELGLLSALGEQQHQLDQENDPTQARLRYLAQIGALLGLTPTATFTGQNTTGTTTGTTTMNNGLLGTLGTLFQGFGALRGG